MLGKVVLTQLQSYFTENKMTEIFHSDFKALHSTEPAPLKVFNDILFVMDSGDLSILILLDLSVTFDTVDHIILISRLEYC